jgi:hypothetical protein
MGRNRELRTRQCIHCGREILRDLRQCPYCREAQVDSRPTPSVSHRIQTSGHVRSGLLLMLLSLAVHYFVGGYSPLAPAGQMALPLVTYLVPVLFVSGLAMSLWGVLLRVRA